MAETEKENFVPLKIGGGIVVENPEGQVLLGMRANKSGFGKWALPGGFQDPEDDSIIEAVVRELEEEAGIKTVEVKGLISIDDSQVSDKKHMNFGVLAVTNEAPKVVNPEEISEWKWFSKKEMPKQEEIFEPSRITIQSYLEGKLQVNSPLK